MSEDREKIRVGVARTMMSRSVSRLTLNGMFLMTMAVGIISSSMPGIGVPGASPGVIMCPMGGEPPEEDKSELLGGERDRLSGMAAWLSSHCCQRRMKVRHMR